LTYLHPLGAFGSMMKIGFWGGLVIAIPYILFVIAQFVMPALKKNEKPYFRKAFVIGGGLFFIGVLMCYGFVLPIAIAGMVQIADWMGVPTTQWQADEYFQFTTMFMLGMGLSFEIPVILLTLVKIGIVPHEWMEKGRMYFFIANMVICAFITPDAVSTIFMVIPVQVLLEICIQISKRWNAKRKSTRLNAASDDTPLALLGIAQRQIKAERRAESGITRNRKSKSNTPQTIGEWIRFWRVNKAQLQRQLAVAAGVPVRRLHEIETNVAPPTKDEIAAIGRALGIDLQTLTREGQQ